MKRRERLSSALTSAPSQPLYERLDRFDTALLDLDARTRALDRFFSLPSERQKPGRFWRVDFDSLVPDATAIEPDAAQIVVESSDPRVIVDDLATAARRNSKGFVQAFGGTGIAESKFGALAQAFAGSGVFVYIPADHACDDPIVLRYHAPRGAAVFPWTVVFAERGARATVIERLNADSNALIVAAAEVITGEHTDVTYAVVQEIDPTARVIASRAARPGRDARIAWRVAELGGELAAGDLRVTIDEAGADVHLSALFFPRFAQHVDLISTVEHSAGEATSETVVKSAARERGQARFLGNIRIAPHAQGSDARLRDDALLLSPTAHVDSVPALEIGANDVKAYHGATVGAMDQEQIFYMESRGIERSAAERMIALGFFEPVIETFPSAELRNEIRTAVAAKLS